MKVKLVNYSHAPEIGDLLQQVAYAARVSNPTNQNNTETAEKLVRYLIKHQHWSPLEMVSVCMEIETTRDIARQILRHRSFSFQEFSQRYADPTKDLHFETREARLQDLKNRQNSIETSDYALELSWQAVQEKVISASQDAYKWAIDNGIAKEQARSVLPEGITASRMYMNGTLRSHLHYIQLRTEPGTQKEHRLLAFECAKAIEPIFPMIMEFVHSDLKN